MDTAEASALYAEIKDVQELRSLALYGMVEHDRNTPEHDYYEAWYHAAGIRTMELTRAYEIGWLYAKRIVQRRASAQMVAS